MRAGGVAVTGGIDLIFIGRDYASHWKSCAEPAVGRGAH